MNNEGYSVICSKCGSTNIKYDYQNTTINSKDNRSSTPVKCLDCNYETVETK